MLDKPLVLCMIRHAMDNYFTIIYRNTDTGSRRTVGVKASGIQAAKKLAVSQIHSNEIVETVF